MAIHEQWRNSFRTHEGFVEVSDLHTRGKFKRSERLKERQIFPDKYSFFTLSDHDLQADSKKDF